MGLDFSHGDAHWAYGGFNRFRERLAKEIGIDLEKMEGFAEKNPRPWKVKDPIVALLNHSDCDGQLSPYECQVVAPRLRELVKDWPDDEEHEYDKQNAILLADAMELAAKSQEPLKFC